MVYVLVQGEMVASPEIFAHLTQLLMPLASGRMCAVLEVSQFQILVRFIFKVVFVHFTSVFCLTLFWSFFHTF